MYFTEEEKKINKKFIETGYMVKKIDSTDSLIFIRKIIPR